MRNQHVDRVSNASQSTVAWVTGLSNPRDCGLSDSQSQFIMSLELPGSQPWKRCALNFPYDETLVDPGSRIGLLSASLHNGRQFVMDALGWRRQRNVDVFNRISENGNLLLIAGSCGMQTILDSNIDRRRNVSVIGLGPVGWRRPVCPHLLIQGEQDWISRLFYRRQTLRFAGQGHLDYQSNAKILAVVNDWICNNILK